MSGPDVGVEQSRWLSGAVADSHGKGTPAELIERLLFRNHGKAVLPRRVCSFREQTEALDHVFARIELLPPEIREVLRQAILVTSTESHVCKSAFNLEAAEATQSHLKATPKPPQSLLIANRLRPQSHPKATSKPPQSHPKATLKPPQSHPKATLKPPLNQLIKSFQDQGGAQTTCFLRALGLMRIAVLGPSVAGLTSLAPCRLARYGSTEAYVRANARLCPNSRKLRQAVAQSEALAGMREGSLPVLARVITGRCGRAAVAAFRACVPDVRGRQAYLFRGESFYSLHHRGFVARSRGRSGQKCDFRRRRFACTGLFELGSVSKPPTSWRGPLLGSEINR